jgi:hypothetical protein
MYLRRSLTACALVLALAPATTAPAAIITLTMSPSSQDVVPGGSGYVLDFTMTTSSAIDLGGFNTTVTVPTASGISFTGGDSSVANYVFAGNSLGLLFSNPSGSNTADITDDPVTPNQHLDAGTYGLGEIYFSVAADAPAGSVIVTLDAATSFTQGVPPYATYEYTPAGGSSLGTINVAGVPEPSTLVSGLLALAVGPLIVRRRSVQTRTDRRQ